MKKKIRKIYDKELGLSKGIKLTVVCAFVFIFIAMLGVFHNLNDRVEEVMEKDVWNTLINANSQNTVAIYNELNRNRQLLQALAEDMKQSKSLEPEIVLERLKPYSEHFGYYGMGVIYPDGTFYTTLGTQFQANDETFVKNVFEGNFVITEDKMFQGVQGEALNILTAPVLMGDEVPMAVIAAYRSSDFAELLNVESFGGKGSSCIVNSNGKVVAAPERRAMESFAEIVEYIDRNEDFSPDADEWKRSCVSFSYRDQEYLACMEELGIRDWYTLTFVSRKDAFAGVSLIRKMMLVNVEAVWRIVFACLAVIALILYTYRNRIRKLVFEDELLHEKNYEYLKMYFKTMDAEEKANTALMAMDVDKFKAQNLIYGSQYGDHLLQYINRIFKEELPQDELFRVHADRFCAMIQYEDIDEIARKAAKLAGRAEKDVENGEIHTFTMSFGACPMSGYEELGTIYSNATIAKNLVKGRWVRKYALFREEMKESSLKNLELSAAFNEAIREQEFQIYYQPKYDMRTKKIIGAEALVRWMRKGVGMMYPGQFIPCFEENGQIVLLDGAVLELVCSQMREMLDEGLKVKRISVNLSRANLRQMHVVREIRRVIESYGIDPSMLAFEITESALYDDKNALDRIVEELHSLGCIVEMDDYGTGISTLNSLASIDFDTIKVDKSFIDRIGDEKTEAVIRSTISLAKTLGMRLVAEGVEEEPQARFLVENGCYYGQGYLYSKPIPAEAYWELLRKEKQE